MTTVTRVNKALIKEGIKGQIIKGKGYFYFVGDLFDKVNSIYSIDLNGWTTTELIKYIKAEIGVNPNQ